MNAVKLALTSLLFVVVTALMMGLVVKLIIGAEPVRKPEPCVVVGQTNNGHEIIVCDREAARRWGQP